MRSSLVFSSFTALALALAGSAFAQQSPATTPSQGAMPQAQMPAQGQMQPGHTATSGQAQKQKLSEKDKKFAKEAAIVNMAEVELGKLAQQNAQDADVKQFGERMVRDHSAANQRLATILANTDVSMPQQLDEQHRKVYDKLSKMRGAEFDRNYMHDMVEGHEKAVKMFRNEAEHANAPDMKAYAQNTLPVIEQHLKLAHEVNRSLTAMGSSGQAQGHKNR